MTGSPPVATRFARWALLLAALLQFAGAAAGPWAHFAALRTAPAALVAGALPTGDSDAPAPHSELTCLFCHNATQQALPAPGSPALTVSFVRQTELAAQRPVPGATAPARPSARAPPSA